MIFLQNFYGSSQIKNIVTDTLDLGELRVDDIYQQKLRQKVRKNIYQSGKSSFQ